MTRSYEDRIAGIEEGLLRDDPEFVEAMRQGRPSRPGREPGEVRRGRAWLALVLAIAAVVAGALLPQGLLLAAGLVGAGFAVSLFEAPAGGRDAPTGGRPDV